MSWKELTSLISIRRLLSAMSALVNKRVMTRVLQKTACCVEASVCL